MGNPVQNFVDVLCSRCFIHIKQHSWYTNMLNNFIPSGV